MAGAEDPATTAILRDTTWDPYEAGLRNMTTPGTPVLTLQNMLQVKVANFLDLWVEAVILFGGVAGNILQFVVIACNKSYSALPFYLYLKVLAVVDVCSLSITLTTHWINYNFLRDNKNLYLCKTILFTATQCLDFGACIIALMSVDRLVAVVMPLKYRSLNSMRNSVIKLSIIGCGTFIKNIYTFYTAGFSLKGANKQCAPQYNAEYWLDEAFVWVDLLVGSVIPFFVIVGSNIWLLMALWKQPVVLQTVRKHKKEKTLLLLLISSTFLLFTLPRKLFTLTLSNIAPPKGLHQVANYRLGHAITSKLWHLNSAINIWLCIISAGKFRRDLIRLITCRGQVVEPLVSGTATSVSFRSREPKTTNATLAGSGIMMQASQGSITKPQRANGLEFGLESKQVEATCLVDKQNLTTIMRAEQSGTIDTADGQSATTDLPARQSEI